MMDGWGLKGGSYYENNIGNFFEENIVGMQLKSHIDIAEETIS